MNAIDIASTTPNLASNGVTWASRSSRESAGLTLRDYQIEAIDYVVNAIENEDPARVQVLSLPTGSGKTLVAGKIALDFLDRHSTARILWLAPQWELLEQAWATLRQISQSELPRAGKLGPRHQLSSLPVTRNPRLLLTTVQTWYQRRNHPNIQSLLTAGPLLVIHDEQHWAIDKSYGNAVINEYLGRARIIGLSATPQVNPLTHQLIFQKSFGELCPEYLATPIVHNINTGVSWSPVLHSGEISAHSLATLGNKEPRNRLIVDQFQTGISQNLFSRAVIYCCDIKHANRLEQWLARRGTACRAVHSSRSRSDNRAAIDAFRIGKVACLITVAMLTEGFDVPEIDAIFLARPTTSLTLLAQMLGRGARKLPGKSSFHIFEYHDSVVRAGSRLFQASDYVQKSVVRVPSDVKGGALKHREPFDTPRFENLDLHGFVGVPFVRDQTFGVEIELSSPNNRLDVYDDRWWDIAKEIICTLTEAAQLPVHPSPLDYHESDDTTQWRLTVDETCGWEIVSPILVGAQGFEELKRVADAVTLLVERSGDLCVNTSTGLHITLATRLTTRARKLGFWRRLMRLEKGLYTLVAPSRLYDAPDAFGEYNRRRRNKYCRPICETDLSKQRDFSRYHSVNLTQLSSDDEIQLLEVRMHHGTTEARKIIPWISLWMQIFNHSRYDWRTPPTTSGAPVPTCSRVLPKGNSAISRWQVDEEDILLLLEREGIVLPAVLNRALHVRRRELCVHWESAVPNRVRSWGKSGWYEDC